jgi:predicted RNase H-like nuclease (RuvC/YqgF family)
MENSVVTILTAVIGSSMAGTAVGYLLRRRHAQAEARQVEADAIERYQRVVAELWRRIEELEARASELEQKLRSLEDETRVLRQLLRAYERRYGRRFRVVNGDVIEEHG